jgi:NADPH:quinone reductase-like Zn-dependent oxidoreductase/acyl carrier protein
VVIADLAVQGPMVVPETGALTVQTIVTRDGSDSASLEIYSEDPESPDSWRLHASATIDRSAQGTVPQAVGIDPAAAVTVDASDYYARLGAAGVDYGTAFRAISDADRTDGASRATLTVPASVAAEARQHQLHPAVVDSCLQALGLAFPATASDAIYLPMGVERYSIVGTPSARMVCHASVRNDGIGETVIGDVVLTDADSGADVAHLSGIRFKRASSARLNTEHDRNLLYELAWRPLSVDADVPVDNAEVVIVGARAGLAAEISTALTHRGSRVAMIEAGEAIAFPDNSNPLRVINVLDSHDRTGSSADDARERSGQLLSLLQSLGNRSRGPADSRTTLSVVTRGAHAVTLDDVASPGDAAVWALGRVAAVEYPSLACRLIDVAPGAAIPALLAALFGHQSEREIAVRAGGLHAPRLVASAHDTRARSQEQACTLEISTRGVLEGLELRPAEPEPPRAGEVQLRVEATGLNFRDVLNAMGMYPGDAGPLGSECVGIVTGLGDGVSGVSIGDRVMAMTTRGFSTYAISKPGLLSRVPAGMRIEDAATIPIAFLTAGYALQTLAGMKAGERVLIHAAAGGVGLAAVQLAQRAGAEIFATAGSPEKRDFLRRLGIRHVMDSRTTEFAEEIRRTTHGDGIDIVLNSLTGDAIDKSLGVLRAGGRFIEIGKTDLWTPERVAELAPGVSYQVLYLGDECVRVPDEIEAMLRALVHAFEAGDLRPLPARVFPLDQVEQAFRFMAQARHIGKVVVLQRTATPDIRRDGSYVVTGGTSGLGLKTAEWLIDGGAGHVVVAGRRAPAGAAAESLASLRARGARITVLQEDVSNRDAVDRILSAAAREGLRLAGIFHAAGVIDDGMLAQQTSERFDAVFAPKASAAWHLHEATRDTPLDFFVLYSAGAALFGSPGQGAYAAANGFLDALAHFRTAHGLPATSINWGPWAEVGMAARLGARDHERWAAQGLRMIQPAEGLRALESAIGRRAPQLAALAVDWNTFLADGSDARDQPLLRELARATASPQTADRRRSITAAIEDADPADRLELLRAHIRDQVQKVLAVDGEVITDTQGLMDLGMDSLMSVELSNRLKTSLGKSLPTTLAFEYPTVSALTAYLSELLGIVAAPAAGDGAPDRQNHDSLTEEVAGLSEEEAALSLEAELQNAGY